MSDTKNFPTLIPMEVHKRVRLEDSGPGGEGELSKWILGAIRQALEGRLILETSDPAAAGVGVGKVLRAEPELLAEIDQAAEALGLGRNEWVKLAVFHRMEKEYPAPGFDREKGGPFQE